MTPISYRFQSDDAVESAEIVLPATPKPNFPSCGVFAFAKSGSVLVNAIVGELMAAAGVPVVDWPSICYEKGVDTSSFLVDLGAAFPAQGYCFAGFRGIPRSFLGASAIKRLRKVLVVRDPRDMLVSRYFSTNYSHGFEPKGTAQFAALIRQLIDDGHADLDAYCLFYSWIVNEDFFMHRGIVCDQNTKVLRYEDFIYEKLGLVRSLNDWFGLVLPRATLEAVAQRYEAIPETERPDQHVRQAHPGDFRRKLKPATIAALNGVLANYMATFGYV